MVVVARGALYGHDAAAGLLRPTGAPSLFRSSLDGALASATCLCVAHDATVPQMRGAGGDDARPEVR